MIYSVIFFYLYINIVRHFLFSKKMNYRFLKLKNLFV